MLATLQHCDTVISTMTSSFRLRFRRLILSAHIKLYEAEIGNIVCLNAHCRVNSMCNDLRFLGLSAKKWKVLRKVNLCGNIAGACHYYTSISMWWLPIESIVEIPLVESTYLSLSSFHCSLKVTWTLYSYQRYSINTPTYVPACRIIRYTIYLQILDSGGGTWTS